MRYEFDKGEYNEGYSWEIHINEKIDMEYSTESKIERRCKHLKPDGTLPRAIEACNEGGHNSTRVCLDCIEEAWAEIELGTAIPITNNGG